MRCAADLHLSRCRSDPAVVATTVVVVPQAVDVWKKRRESQRMSQAWQGSDGLTVLNSSLVPVRVLRLLLQLDSVLEAQHSQYTDQRIERRRSDPVYVLPPLR